MKTCWVVRIPLLVASFATALFEQEQRDTGGWHRPIFRVAVPFTSQFARWTVVSEGEDIDSLQHTLVISEDPLRAVTKERAWNEKHHLHTHVYYHAMKALKLREELYAHVIVLKDRAGPIRNPS